MNVHRWIPAAAAAMLVALSGGMTVAAHPQAPVAHPAATHAVAHKAAHKTGKKVTTAKAAHTKGRKSAGAVDVVNALLLTGKLDNRNGPELSPGNFTFPANTLVRMTIKNFDDGPAPAPGYTQLKGVIGGRMLVNGKAVTGVKAATIAHTFTITALGLNVPIPAAPTGRYVTVTFTFRTPAKAGIYVWQCYALCGNAANGWGFPMNTVGMMKGIVQIG